MVTVLPDFGSCAPFSTQTESGRFETVFSTTFAVRESTWAFRGSMFGLMEISSGAADTTVPTTKSVGFDALMLSCAT